MVTGAGGGIGAAKATYLAPERWLGSCWGRDGTIGDRIQTLSRFIQSPRSRSGNGCAV